MAYPRRFLVTVSEYVESTYEVTATTGAAARSEVERTRPGITTGDSPTGVDIRSWSCRRVVLASRTMEELIAELRDVRGPDECWPWLGSLDTNDYGRLNLDGEHHSISRLVYEREVGPIGMGMEVCHTCDNPPCANPSHYFLGTTADNQRDKVSKGRQARGERNGGGGKLSDDDVRQIRTMAGTPEQRSSRSADRPPTYAAIGKRFGISATMVGFVVRGQQWSHVQ